MKKIICTLVAITMIYSLFAMGSKEEEKTEGTVISVLFRTPNENEAYDEWEVLQWIKEETGVTLEIHAIPTANWDKEKAKIIESGNIPDIVASSYISAENVASGLFLPISDYEDRMPNFLKFIEENNLREEIDSNRFADGKYYNLPVKTGSNRIQDRQWLIRTDIFEKHGMPIPTSIEDIYESGLKLKELYPDSAPISNGFGMSSFLQVMSGAFGTREGLNGGMHYDYDKKEWLYAPTSEEYKEMLIYMNALVENGILDKDFATLSSSNFTKKVTQGKTFMMSYWAANINSFNNQGKAIDPNFQIEAIYPPKGTDDNVALSPKGLWAQSMIFPASLADDEEHLNAVLKYIDWGYTEEAEILLTFGKEGLTYEINEAGYKVLINPPNVPSGSTAGLNNNNLAIRQDEDFLYGTLSEDQAKLFEKITKDNIVSRPNPQPPLTMEELNQAVEIEAKCSSYIKVMVEKFIFGTESFDNWDEYVATLEEMGCNTLVEIYNR